MTPGVCVWPGRSLDRSRPVWVYGNVGQGWSIVQDRTRVGGFQRAALRDVRFLVQPAIRDAVEPGTLSIHAFAEGWLEDWPADGVPMGARRVRYRMGRGFYTGEEDLMRDVCSAARVYFDVYPWGVELVDGVAADPGGAPVVMG